MTVKQLINELLNMPMNTDVQIAYIDKDGEYKYQDIVGAVYYDVDEGVGIVGWRN